ncbi:MAG: OsmC family protein [Brucella anthropi]
MAVRVKTTWSGNIKGRGRIEGVELDAPVAIPSEFGGTGEGTDPKTLLISSAAACYLMTLVAILQNRKLPVSDLELVSEGTDPKQADFTIEHRIKLDLLPEASQEHIAQVESAVQQADKACVIGNILKKANVSIKVEGSVSVTAASAG